LGGEKQYKRWEDHLENLLNTPTPSNSPGIPPAEEHLPTHCIKHNRLKVCRAMKELKNGEVAGPDGITAGPLKATLETTTEILFPLFEKI
jgi:hypothetical protein